MRDASLAYQNLVEATVPFFIEHGTVDLVAVVDAAELGVGNNRFIADVADAANDKEHNG